ncbi:MAG: Stp1/IreP family PP2C-type Ser/Thr phosphatase [Blastocatellia bacterium]
MGIRWNPFRSNRKKKAGGPVRPTSALAVPGEGGSEFDYSGAFQSDVGCYRQTNEDSGIYFVPPEPDLLASRGRLVLVADGMGGHLAGEVASRMAVDLIMKEYYEGAGEVGQALRHAFEKANREIHGSAQNDRALEGMGTTCTALVLKNGSAVAAHVGDSRLYLVRDHQIYLMTEDHSAVMDMVKRGLLTLEQARHHPDKNVILRALGSHPDVDVTVWEEPFPVRGGDRFLVCSDGLYDLVEDDEIRDLAIMDDINSAVRRLVQTARDRGGYDNITVALLNVRAGAHELAPVRETRELEVSK